MTNTKLTAEEFFRDKLNNLFPAKKSITLSQELITAETGMRWAHEFANLPQFKEVIKEVSDNPNIVLDNKHEIDHRIGHDFGALLSNFLPWYKSKQAVNTFSDCKDEYVISEYFKHAELGKPLSLSKENELKLVTGELLDVKDKFQELQNKMYAYEGLIERISKDGFPSLNTIKFIKEFQNIKLDKTDPLDYKAKYENLLQQFKLFAEIISTENHPNNINNPNARF